MLKRHSLHCPTGVLHKKNPSAPRFISTAWFLWTLLIITAPDIATAEWKTEEIARPDGNGMERIAVVENPAGYRLEIYKNDDSVVYGSFTLRAGFDVFAKGSCPTFRVDRGRAINLTKTAPCKRKGNRTEFVVGTIENDQIKSLVLLLLMNGSHVTFRYQLKNVGYQETGFELRRSKQALAEVIGPGTSVTVK